jgi:hypothetical protein
MTAGVRAVIRGAAACSAWMAIVAATPAAQTAADRPVRRFEAAAGALWLNGAALGSGDAVLRANQVPGGDFTLFATETRAAAAPGFDARLGYWLTRTVALEAGFAFMQPALRTRITSDAEGAAGLTVEERLDQYFIDASVVVLLDALRFRERTVPFVSAGAGYLRQLHEGLTLVETGQVYHGGAGIRHWLRRRDAGFARALGLRVDGRVYVLARGVRLEDGPRTHGAISGAVFVTF